MNLPSQSQFAAIGRHVLTSATTAVTLLAALHLVSAGDAAKLADAINNIGTGIAQIAAVIGPLVMTATAWWAASTASPKAQIAAVNATDGIKVVKDFTPGAVVTEPPPKS